MIIGRGRVLHAGGSFVTVEALFEDALGRAVAHATGSVTVTAIDPPPPPVGLLSPVEEPTYATADPMNRPLDAEAGAEGDLPHFGRFLGARLLDVDAARVRVELPTSEWFCMLRREVAPGIIGLLGNLAIGRSITELIDADQRYVILQATTTALASVPADGRLLTAVGAVRHRRDDVVVAEGEISDEDGNPVAIVQGPCLIRERGDHARHQMSDRVLLTVLFTDIVGSTERAQQLGDVRWREVLEQHDVICRRQLAIHHGRHVKSLGDGVLATFTSPSRAVQCAVALRDALRQVGLQMRAGIHTGECEQVGHDVAGLAVHVASRVQAAARPGEILISGAVRDLTSPSEVAAADRGRHDLKGLDGTWQLFSVDRLAT
jgi:class 3 adenylate cyclase